MLRPQPKATRKNTLCPYPTLVRSLGNTQKAVTYFEDAMKDYEAQKNYTKCSDVAVSLSILFKGIGQADSSLQTIQYAIQLAKDHNASRYHKDRKSTRLNSST